MDRSGASTSKTDASFSPSPLPLHVLFFLLVVYRIRRRRDCRFPLAASYKANRRRRRPHRLSSRISVRRASKWSRSYILQRVCVCVYTEVEPHHKSRYRPHRFPPACPIRYISPAPPPSRSLSSSFSLFVFIIDDKHRHKHTHTHTLYKRELENWSVGSERVLLAWQRLEKWLLIVFFLLLSPFWSSSSSSSSSIEGKGAWLVYHHTTETKSSVALCCCCCY